MNEQEINNLVASKIIDFESIKSIQPSEDWNNKLIDRIGTSKEISMSSLSKVSIAVLSIIVMINVGFAFNKLQSNSSYKKNKELQVISKELLINEIL